MVGPTTRPVSSVPITPEMKRSAQSARSMRTASENTAVTPPSFRASIPRDFSLARSTTRRFMWRPLGRRRVPGVRRGSIPAEGPLDELPRPRRIHVVRALTRRRVGQDAVGILPQAILLVAILELDPEPARED